VPIKVPVNGPVFVCYRVLGTDSEGSNRPGCNSGCATADHGVSSCIERVLKLRYCIDAAESLPIRVSMPQVAGVEMKKTVRSA